MVIGLRGRARVRKAAEVVPLRPTWGRKALGVAHRATALLGQALASDDASAEGVRADAVLADPEAALLVLGNSDVWPAARHAVIQRYGRVGALVIVGYEGRWRLRFGAGSAPNPPELEEMLDRFGELDAEGFQRLLAGLDQSEARRGLGASDAVPRAMRWLHATYAVAARDGTEPSHRAYMAALDRVMRLAARRLAS